MADEPTGNLDTARSREIMELLTRFNRDDGVTIVMVTHEADMAQYARRLIHFRDGRIASDAAPPRSA
jgi:putative ABC transport system ATP-binding protein